MEGLTALHALNVRSKMKHLASKMNLLTALFVTACCIDLCGSEKDKPSFVEKLKSETGASDEELEKGIKFFTKFYVLMRDEIEAGTLDVEHLVETSKNLKETAKDFLASMEREDEMTALITLHYLRALERDGSERASEMMAKQLAQFVEAEFPSTENSQKIRERILEHSKTSPSLGPLIQQIEKPGAQQPAPSPAPSEPGAAGQPATRPESK